MKANRLVLAAVGFGLMIALAACGGSSVKNRSAAEVGKICKAREDDWYEALKSVGVPKGPLGKQRSEIQKSCCPKLAKASRKLSNTERAYLFYTIGGEMDGGTISPRQMEAYRDSEDRLREDMTSADVTKALAPAMAFSQCKYTVMKKYEKRS